MAIFPMSQNTMTFFIFPALFALVLAITGTMDQGNGFGLLSYVLGSYFGVLALTSLIDPELDYFIYGLPLEIEGETSPSDNKWGSTSPYVYAKTVRELAIALAISFFEYQRNLQAVTGLGVAFAFVKVADAGIVAWKGGERAYQWKSQAMQAFWVGVMVAVRTYK